MAHYSGKTGRPCGRNPEEKTGAMEAFACVSSVSEYLSCFRRGESGDVMTPSQFTSSVMKRIEVWRKAKGKSQKETSLLLRSKMSDTIFMFAEF